MLKLFAFCFSFTIGMNDGFTTLVLKFVGIWDAEGGGGKTGAESAALHGLKINNACMICTLTSNSTIC